MAEKITNSCWRWIQGGPCDGATNMAIDEALLLSVVQGKAPPTIRLYGWSPRGLSLGSLQRVRADVDVERCLALGIDLIRRPTGGRAVLHDRELTYSVVAPERLFPVPKSVMSVYREISRALVAGLDQLGVKSQMVSELKFSRERKGCFNPAVCFATRSAYEVAVCGKKIIGSAQRRFKSCVLQQGSILLALDRMLLFSLFLQTRGHHSHKMGEEMTSLGEVLGREVGYDEAAIAMKKGFRQAWGVSLLEGEVEETERKLAEELRQDKYAREEWNLRR